MGNNHMFVPWQIYPAEHLIPALIHALPAGLAFMRIKLHKGCCATSSSGPGWIHNADIL
jgi:hypothetical protein